jgi:predicted phosphodiesterase
MASVETSQEDIPKNTYIKHCIHIPEISDCDLMIQVISDIHLELHPSTSSSRYPEIPVVFSKDGKSANVLVLAGDIGNLKGEITHSKTNTSSQFYEGKLYHFLKYCSENWKIVMYVPGNHEFYHSRKTYSTLCNEYQTLCSQFPNVYWLYNECLMINDIHFYGTPLFTELDIGGSYSTLNDFCHIHTKNDKGWTIPMTVSSWNREFSQPCHTWLQTILKDISKLNDETYKKDNTLTKIVLITHFPPIREGTSHPKYDGQSTDLKHYFANDIHKLLQEYLPEGSIVISGHTHYCYDFVKDGIRYVSHQMGYLSEMDDTGFMDCFREVIEFS